MIDTQFDFAIGIPPYNGGTRQMIEGMTDAEGKTEKVTSLSMTKAVITLLGYVDE